MSILFLFLFLEKKKISRSSIFCLSIIDSIYEPSRKTSFFGSGLDRFCQRNERGARSERMLLRSGSSREENKMLLPLPLSFLALLIFPSNAGRAREEET